MRVGYHAEVIVKIIVFSLIYFKLIVMAWRFAVFTLLILVASCESKKTSVGVGNTGIVCNNSVVPRGSRLLGYDILNLTETGSFEDNIAKAKTLGIGYIQIHLYWDMIETDTDGVVGAPYVMTRADPDGTLGALNSVALANDIKLSIIISPIDIPGRQVPVDIQASGIKFNHATMKARFEALVDFLFAGATPLVDPSNVVSLSVGNEIDHYDWAGNGDTQAAYRTFLSNIKAK